LAKCVVLNNESQDVFNQALDQHLEKLNPTDGVEHSMVEEMVAAQWRLRRLWSIETTLFNEAVQQSAELETDRLRIASAFSDLASSDELKLLDRYEARLHRAYQRSLHNLVLFRQLDASSDDAGAEVQPDEELQPNEDAGPDADPAPENTPLPNEPRPTVRFTSSNLVSKRSNPPKQSPNPAQSQQHTRNNDAAQAAQPPDSSSPDAPAFATAFALPTSQILKRMRGFPGTCSSRNCSALLLRPVIFRSSVRAIPG